MPLWTAPDSSTTLDREEVARFAKLAGEWWDANGPFKPLHRINPVRLTYIRDQLCRKFGRDKAAAASLAGLTVLDIGCGGGLVGEPLARLGAEVTGIDPAPENIAAAKAHAEGARLDIAYRATTAEELGGGRRGSLRRRPAARSGRARAGRAGCSSNRLRPW